MMLACASLLTIGNVAGLMFNLRWPLPWACGLALLLWTIFAATSGMLAAFQALEHARVVRLDDGREDVLVSLKLGPFSYTINVRKARDTEPEP